jgi:hypothetical protein
VSKQEFLIVVKSSSKIALVTTVIRTCKNNDVGSHCCVTVCSNEGLSFNNVFQQYRGSCRLCSSLAKNDRQTNMDGSVFAHARV